MNTKNNKNCSYDTQGIYLCNYIENFGDTSYKTESGREKNKFGVLPKKK